MSLTKHFRVQKKRPDIVVTKESNINQSNEEIKSVPDEPTAQCSTVTQSSKQEPLRTESPKIQKFQSIEFESPRKKTHACRALALLDSERLPLPRSYQVLEEKFRHIDTVVSMFGRRNEICTFRKLAEAVQEITRRTLKLEDLARIKFLMPNAYQMKQERHIPGVYDATTYNKYQLTVYFNDDSSDDKLTSSKLVLRRQTFKKKLLEVVMEHHKKFLAALKIDCDSNNIHAWHSSFKLEEVPPVQQSNLPQPPYTESYTTAKEVLEVSGSKLQRKAKEALAIPSISVIESHSAKVTTVPPKDEQLKGISSDLVERVRQKQAIRAAATISVDPLTQKRLTMLARLPELCRILRSLFVTERKAAILLTEVIQKLCDSHSSHLSHGNEVQESTEEHLELIIKIVPSFAQRVRLRNKEYIKINKNISLNSIIAKLET